jgi:MerR family transcriptional regulator/heat shock protein HspR
MRTKRKKGYCSISAGAKMFSVHQQTVRLYEREGLISPKRSAGNTRLFSEEDIDRLEEVIYLTHELGINLAGVEQILKLKNQIKKMQYEMNKLFDGTSEELDKQCQQSHETIQKSAQKILQLKQHQGAASLLPRLSDSESVEVIEDNEQWKIEYEE